MKNISYYEKLIQERRKKTSWKEYVEEICSWYPINLKKVGNSVTQYYDTSDERFGNISKNVEYYSDGVTETEKGTFEESFITLWKNTHKPLNINFGGADNCTWANQIFQAKNAYLSSVVGYDAENILYSFSVFSGVHNILNSVMVIGGCTNIYNSLNIRSSSFIYFSKNINNSSNIYFSSNCIGCDNCILCDSLTNASYCIKNKVVGKEEFEKEKKVILTELYTNPYEVFKDMAIKNIENMNSSGYGIFGCRDVEIGILSRYTHSARNIGFCDGGESGSSNFYDCFDCGLNSHDFYAVVAAGASSHNCYCSNQIESSSYVYYSFFLQHCHHCFGCIGLKNKSYCIYNIEYSKDEWESKVCEIFAEMEKNQTLGRFLPTSINPYAINDTMAYILDSTILREDILKKGYLWRDEPIRVDIPEGMRVLKNTELDQFQGLREKEWYIDPEVLNVVISDEKGNYYRIVKMEYDFLMRHGLPLPTLHWLNRIRIGFTGMK